MPPHLADFTSGTEFDSQVVEKESPHQEPRPASESGINLGGKLPPLSVNSSHFQEAGLRTVLEKQDQLGIDNLQDILSRSIQDPSRNLTVDDLAQSQHLQYNTGIDPGVETSTPVLEKAPTFR